MSNAISGQLMDPEAAAPSSQGMMAVAQSRHAQEVQAMVVMAKQFPRDETAAITRIMTACKRKRLAEAAIYTYPRGGTKVQGPSIRLAEVLAQNWGNIDFGVIELEQKRGESIVMTFAWDMETNCRQTRVFTAKHERHTREGVKRLDDPRDIYEMIANVGARRVRACILGVIPKDVQDQAEEQCRLSLQTGHDKPIIDRIRMMVQKFQELQVTQPMIENRLGHKVDTCDETELVMLRGIYTSLKDGASEREDHFELADKPKRHREVPFEAEEKGKEQGSLV